MNSTSTPVQPTPAPTVLEAQLKLQLEEVQHALYVLQRGEPLQAQIFAVRQGLNALAENIAGVKSSAQDPFFAAVAHRACRAGQARNEFEDIARTVTNLTVAAAQLQQRLQRFTLGS